MRFLLRICVAAIFFGAMGARSQILSGVKWPIPFDDPPPPGGRVAPYKALLMGNEIIPLSNGVFMVRGVRIESYQPDGITNLIARAPECIYNADAKVASSTNRLELEAPNGLLIDGTGFLCHLASYLTISNDVRTFVQQRLLQSSTNLPGPVTATNQVASTNIALTIFADRFELDSSSNLITYLGHVHLEHSQLRLESEILRARRSTNGSLDRVVAEQEVRILNKVDNSRAFGDLAIYTAAPSEMLQLSGHARWQDDQRQSRADLFLFEPKTRHLRAEGKAWMSLPRQMVGQPDLWNARQTTNQAKIIAAMPTNAPVEISAEVLDLQMPNTNQPARFMLADRNVVIVSAADKSRATADRAVFDERTGMMELRGDAAWVAGDRISRGQVLQFDRTNKVFSARTNAYLRVATSDLGARAASGLPGGKSNSWTIPNFVEVSADDYTYTSNLLVFRQNVRGKLFDTNATRATLACDFLALSFSNQLQSVFASGGVDLDQLPFLSDSGKVSRQAHCEQLHIKMSPGGTVEQVLALTNVVAHQEQWRPKFKVPVRSHFAASIVTADFFPHTNQIRQAIADQDVRISQDQFLSPTNNLVLTNYLIRGEHAVFNGTNNIAELTGHPEAYTTRGSITNAQVLIWDRTKNVFMARQVQGGGQVEGSATNAPKAPVPTLPFPARRRNPK